MIIYIDLLIISFFLILTLAIGIYYGKGIKSFQEYSVGNRKMSTTVIALSLIVTTYGGGILSSRLNFYYQQGFYAFIMDLASSVNFYLASRCIILRMREFTGHLSIAESMGSIYGPAVRMITGIFGIIMTIALLTAQIKFGLDITAMLFPTIKGFTTYSTVILTLLVIGYSTFGGARAVALTDVYQFFLFGLCFPILIFGLLYYAQDLGTGWQKLTDMPQFNTSKILKWNKMLTGVLSYFIWRSVFPFDPARIQRFYMASSIQQAAKVFSKSAMIRILLSISFLSVAGALHIGGHAIKPSQNGVNYIIELAYFPGMRGMLVTAIMALLMSTADSNLHAATVLFTNDVWPIVTGSTKYISKHALKIVRISSAFIGITSLFVALHTINITQLLSKAVHLYGPAVTVPLIMASFGFRPRSAAVLCNIGINTAIAVYRIYYKAQTITQRNVFESLVSSAFILLVIHYLLPKLPNTGWVGIKDTNAWDLANQVTKRCWIKRLQQLAMPFTKKYWVTLFPKQEGAFILFGIYLIISSMVALFFIKRDYLALYIYGYMALMAIGTTLALYPSLHSYQKGGNRLFHWLWPGLLFVLLFMAPIQFAKLGHFRPVVCALLVCDIGIAIVLLSIEISTVMLVLALCIHIHIPPYLSFSNLFCSSHHLLPLELVCACTLTGIAIAGLGTYKYLRDKAKAKFKIMGLTETYERSIALETIYNQANWSRLDNTHGSKMLREMGKMLQEPYQYLHTHGQAQLSETIQNFMQKLSQFSRVLLQRVKAERSLELNPKTVQPVMIKSAIVKINEAILGFGKPMALLLRYQTEVKQLLADPTLFECFLTLNVWGISKSLQTVDHMVTLTIADTSLRFDAAEPNQPALTLPALAFVFSTDASIQQILPTYDVKDELTPICLPKTEKAFYQIESRQIVQAHGGIKKL